MARVATIRPARGDPELRLVTTDDGARYRIDAESLAALGLEVGDGVGPDLLVHLASRDERHRAKDAALRLLALRLRSEGEVRDRLRRRGFSEAAADDVVEDLRGAGALDDRRFAEAWVRGRQALRPTGRMRLRWELRQKRVPAEVIEDAVAGAGDELEAAREAARRRLPALRGLDRDTQRRRLGGFLQRRGFAGGTVVRVLREVLGRTPW